MKTRLLIPIALFAAIGAAIYFAASGDHPASRPDSARSGSAYPPTGTASPTAASSQSQAPAPLSATDALPGVAAAPRPVGADASPQRNDSGLEQPLHESVAAPASGVFVSASGTATQMKPNEIGVFPRQTIKPREAVTVRVAYPSGTPGDLVVAAVEDGGLLENGKHTVPMRLDEQRTAAFRFQATEAEGLSRITLQKGVDVKVVEMWAGPEPKLAGDN